MKRFIAAVLAVFMSGCASIPLGTMLEFRSFGKEELLAIQPEVVRVRLELEEPVRADIEGSELTMRLNYDQGSRTFHFPLVVLNETSIAPTRGLFSKSAGKTQYKLKLSDEGIENFIATQTSIAEDNPTSFNFSFSSEFEEPPSEVSEVTLSVFLKLMEEQGFVTLINNARIAVREG
ncbi:hypothetical protein [Aliidiomarina sanyensis]|uniref:Lipoprotein n=1 Tax=Aliidiomarina sanyensis TaxID=1249555 RepID=A0A432WBA6_9GAMM|nr:hypothetical protein [Aliidiomarina sanyensis]RUO29057.1 hypothetical protein CWE11_10300 [Aliidiomarina sanyensis]